MAKKLAVATSSSGGQQASSTGGIEILTGTKSLSAFEEQAVKAAANPINTITLPIELSEEEQTLFDEYMDGLKSLQALASSTHQQMIASSLHAYEGDVYGYSSMQDSKYNALMRIINENRTKGNGKVIVFAHFHNTINYLAVKLTKDKIGFRVISGKMSDRLSRINAVDDFKNDDSVTVLLSTEVGGEGLDMQFCDTIVNYDLPWNPMVVEQRIGRIDRIGQNSEIIHIYNMLVK